MQADSRTATRLHKDPALVPFAYGFRPFFLVAPPLLRTRNRNTPLLMVIVVLWLIDAAFLYALHRQDVALASRTLLVALDVVLLLITVIGGRVVPAFTASALRKRGDTVEFGSTRWIDVTVIAAMVLVLAGDAFLANLVAAGALAGIAAAAHAIRLARWHGLRTFAEPIVWVLHLAYAWLPIGLALKAVYLATGMAWSANWLHALGVGAAGMMIVGVITRAALGHTGRPLVVNASVALAYGILGAAALVRVFGPAMAPAHREWTIWTAGWLWMIAFAIVILSYTPILLRPRADGKPG